MKKSFLSCVAILMAFVFNVSVVAQTAPTLEKLTGDEEIEWIPMELEIANLTTEVMEVEGEKYLQLNGRDDMNDADVTLFLNDYTGEDKEYEVNAESSMTFGGMELTVLDGKMAQTENTYIGIVHATVTDEEIGGTKYVEFALTMYAAAATELVLTDAIVAVNEELGTLTFNVPTEEGGYFVELSGYTAPGVHEGPQICLFETPEAVAYANYVETVVEGGVITLTGEFTSFMGAKFNVTISGKLPVVEPENPDQGLTLTATGLETQLESDGSYTLQGLAVVNGDESNLMDFMLCVYPTEGYTDAFLNGWSVMIFGAPTPGAFVENEDGTFTYTAQIEDTYGDGTVYNINMSGTIKKTEGPEYMELDDQITNMTFDPENMVIYGGPSTNFEIEVVLGLGEDNFDGSFTLSDESSVVIKGIDAEFIEGYVYDIDPYAPSATAVVKVNWDDMYYAFTLTMSAAPAEATVVVVENAVVEVIEYPIFGDTYEYALNMKGEWVNEADGLTYPVLVEVPVYYPEATEPSTILSTVTVGGMGDDDPWLGFGEGELTVTTVGNTVTATGVVSDWSGLVIDITISGNVNGTGVENTTVTVKSVKTIKNGQLIINRDGKEYNAQGAILK